MVFVVGRQSKHLDPLATCGLPYIYKDFDFLTPQILWYIQRVVFSSIGNIPLYSPQNKGLFYVINRYFLVAEIGYRAEKIGAVIRKRVNASSIVGVTQMA